MNKMLKQMAKDAEKGVDYAGDLAKSTIDTIFPSKLIGAPITDDNAAVTTEPAMLRGLDRPMAAIYSRGKLNKDVYNELEAVMEEVDVLVISGGMIFTFYKAKGYSVGASAVADERLQLAKAILEKAEAKGIRLVLPTHVDVINGAIFHDPQFQGLNKGDTKVVLATEIPDGWIGEGTAKADELTEPLEGMKTVLWDRGFDTTEVHQGVSYKLAELRKKGVKTYSLSLGLPN